MMYWIVYAIFGALESIVDPIMNFWLDTKYNIDDGQTL